MHNKITKAMLFIGMCNNLEFLAHVEMVSAKGNQTLIRVPLCCVRQSADSQFMSVRMTLWVRAGEQGRSGLQVGAAGVMREGQGEGQGEGRGDR